MFFLFSMFKFFKLRNDFEMILINMVDYFMQNTYNGVKSYHYNKNLCEYLDT